MPDDSPSRGRDAAAEAEAADRRRDGRIEDVRPSLLPLLRARELERLDLPDPPAAPDEDPRSDDDLRAAKGIALMALCSGVFWGGLAYLLS